MVGKAVLTEEVTAIGDASDPFFISHGFEKKGDLITFSDTDHKVGLGNVFSLKRLGPEKTQIRVHTLIKRNPLKHLLFRLFLKKKILRDSDLGWQNLEHYCQGLLEDGLSHEAQILLEPHGKQDAEFKMQEVADV